MTTAGHESLVLCSDLAEIDRLLAFIESFCDEAGVAGEIKYKLFLIAEELIVNVMTHGYQGRRDGVIEIKLRALDSEVEVSIEDEARAFDPLAGAPEAVTDAALDDRPIGGLGVHLVKTLVKTIDYHVRDGRNLLRATVAV